MRIGTACVALMALVGLWACDGGGVSNAVPTLTSPMPGPSGTSGAGGRRADLGPHGPVPSTRLG